ncbi:GNAT family N-acetyltransferase [Paenibacillus sp. YIM B09110]|uniref:GNAT family N-acetyltransferase n=1 Tax=Paenibacillus sp. YIM B09110 TaxID=3126102 RepID=UPI00301CCFB7
MDQNKLIINQYEHKYAEQTVKMWRDSKERALGQKAIRSMEEHIYFLNHILPVRFQIEVVIIDEQVVGIIAYNESEINQLYIHIDYQGIGIGQTLLNRVKDKSSGKLTLYTFEVNKIAQRFYEKHGFKVIARGHENEESLSDIQYEWQTAPTDSGHTT